MLKINIATIPHETQRYDTAGDYIEEENGDIVDFSISELPAWEYEFLIALHELIEYHLCKKRKIKVSSIDTFDKKFEQRRGRGDLPDKDMEPGDDPAAPYYKEHQFATYIERLLAVELGIDWRRYEKALTKLEYAPRNISKNGVQ